ncbi:DUF721 domain-containing protein [Patescibacteria group bacterium]|nr:DUF721 domain-containing protein [Patescibacteria group bacterium]MBU1683230.1 DUF721 domain-containing protein [Patescibacteria group bacterium]MBU1935743.1 DUF721 domain-containing protein [Patescibacteria group bacterium]
MEKISNIVGKRLNQHKIGDSARASEAIFKANQYLSQWLKCEYEDARAYKLKDGILWVGTGNATWSQEVWSVSNSLLKKMQEEYGKDYIKKICIRSGVK